jgi:hypothetical protein
MKEYHIVWFEKETDFFSTGKTFEAVNAYQALEDWEKEYPGRIFKAMYTTGH